MRGAGYEVTSHAVSGAPDEIIAGTATDHHIDLLVMGAYGHSPIRHLILGSTTTMMVRTFQGPVLMFR